MNSDIIPDRLRKVRTSPEKTELQPSNQSESLSQGQLQQDIEISLLNFKKKSYARSNIIEGDNSWSKVPLGLRSSMKRQGQYTSEIHRRQSTTYLFSEFNKNILSGIIEQQACQLCQCFPQSQMVSLADCGHKYCIDCMNQYINYKINLHQLVVCPSQNCNKVLHQESELYKDLPKNVKEKYELQKLWRANMDNPNVRLCPRQQCVEGLVDLLADPPICKKCGKTFCKECQLQAHEGPCQQVFQTLFLNWKRCPRCRVFIEKTQGCNHMVCTCRHQFCYLCLADWESSHYQCGLPVYLRTNYQFQPPQSCFKRYLLLFGLSLILPLVIALYTVLLLISMAIWSVLGIFGVPIFALIGVKRQARQCVCLLVPILMVIGIFVGMFFGIYLVCVILHKFMSLYFNALCRSCCCN